VPKNGRGIVKATEGVEELRVKGRVFNLELVSAENAIQRDR
jgi:hypothetical protein